MIAALPEGLVIAVQVAHRPPVVRAPDRSKDDVAALVTSVQRGERAAFGGLYSRFHRAVHAVLLARVRAEDARDLVQDVFAQALEKIADLQDPAAFPGWILSMARNRAVDHLRRARPSSEAAEPAIDPPPRVEAMEALRALRALPEAYRETLIMRLVEGMTGPEIAERTGLTPESVRVNLHRGMKLLRAQLDPEGAPADEEAP
ncbi:MAG: sigma-70 family RNA polymerase sigma factor [Polyangiaceae bacterium]